MRQLLSHILAAMNDRQAAVLCRLVATRGSTPQKPGAAMLVYPDGRQEGTLGGGCVEAEVKQQALTAAQPAVFQFQLDHDYGWDDGLICGGRMDVLVWPLAGTDEHNYYSQLAELHEVGQGGVEVIRFQVPAGRTPTCWLFDRDRQQVQSLGEATADLDAAQPHMHALVKSIGGRPKVEGGFVFLPVATRNRLLIVGGGHVGLAVARLAAELEFDVVVVDDRQEFVSAERFPMAVERISGEMTRTLQQLEINTNTYCLIVTRGHNHDQEALYRLVDRGAAYVGMIGSRRKIRLIFENLLQEGVDPEQLRAVSAPVGLDIGSQTVLEIAVSIAAELVAHRQGVGSIEHRRPSLMDDLS